MKEQQFCLHNFENIHNTGTGYLLLVTFDAELLTEEHDKKTTANENFKGVEFCIPKVKLG